MISPTNLLSLKCMFWARSDTHHLLSFQVTPALCRLSWSWRKPCVFMNSTKTRSSLSTVSLAHTQRINKYNARLFFFSSGSSLLIVHVWVWWGGCGFTSFTSLTIIYSHSPGWTLEMLWEAQSCGFCTLSLSIPMSSYSGHVCVFAVSQSFAQNIHEVYHPFMSMYDVNKSTTQSGAELGNLLAMKCSEDAHAWGVLNVRRSEGWRDVTGGCGFTVGCGQLSLCPPPGMCCY